jgi:predicted anti-sigma-YlaC factor YlaD
LLFFSGVILTVFVAVSMLEHLSCQASPQRAPVSLSSWRNVAMRLLHAAISWSISVSVGMKGIFRMP